MAQTKRKRTRKHRGTPAGPIEQKWTRRKFEAALVNPANRRKMSVIIVGTSSR